MTATQTVVKSIALLLLVLALFVGAFASQRAHADPATTERRMNEILALQRINNHARVLDIIREEISDPGYSGSEHAVTIRVIAIATMGRLASDQGFTQATDSEAMRYHGDGTAAAGADADRASRLRFVLAQYYQNTRRAGRALPLLLEDLTYQRRTRNQLFELRSNDSIASVYNDMGEIELAQAHFDQALQLAATYFDGRSRRPPQEWSYYRSLLEHALMNAASQRDADRILALWPRLQRVVSTYFVPRSSSYLFVSSLFSIAGDNVRAQSMFGQARQVFAVERANLPPASIPLIEADFVCKQARLEAADRNRNARITMDACLDYWRRYSFALNIGGAVESGQAYEAAGADAAALRQYDQGAQLATGLRESFTVSERATFFNAPAARDLFGGRLRVKARAARSANDAPAAFFDAVAAADDMRARQLGDIVGAEQRVDARRLQALASTLPAETLVVALTAMDTSTVVTAFSRTERRSALLPVGRAKLEEDVKSLLAQLSDPASDPAELERSLKSYSAAALGDVRQLLGGRRRIIFLLDGPAALVPPSLFYADDNATGPIGLTAAVSVSPAFRFLLRQPRVGAASAGLLAMGDPAYAQSLSAARIDPAVAPAIRPLRGRLRLAGGGAISVPPLPETRTEVEAIGRLFPRPAPQLFFGADATESRLKTAQFAGVGYLHLATHGVLSGEIPGLAEPALILASERGEDSLLLASEAERLNLSGVELTVLSACNTGSGRVYSGEGVLGLSRAFLIAGSRAVLVSMWPVDSGATEALMKSFYIAHRAGAPPEDALKKAMQEVRATDPHPMFWAPFFLVQGRGL